MSYLDPYPDSGQDFIAAATQANSLAQRSSSNFSALTGANRASDLLSRAMALVTGALVLAASTWAVIESGHQAGAHAGLTASLGLGVLVGAIIVTRARRGMAAAVVAAMLCGEAFSFLGSAERIVLAREAQAAAIRDQQARYDTATSRLASAEQAARSAAERATKVVAEKNCRSECRALLESERASHEAAIASARDALAGIEKPGSATPLADRLGWQPWVLDLSMAALLSIGANGLAAVLVAFGTRPMQHRDNVPAELPKLAVVHDVNNDTQQTASQEVQPDPDGGTRAAISMRAAGVLKLITSNGGAVEGPQRQIASRLGTSPASLNRALGELAAAGLIDLESDRLAGTKVRVRTA